MTATLKAHIEEQFHESVMLKGLIEALVILNCEGHSGSGSFDAVLDAANTLMGRLSDSLDAANLPKDGEARRS